MDRPRSDLDLIAGMPGSVLAIARDFEHGEKVPPHDHPVAQLLHTLTGVMMARTPGRAWAVPPGRALWIPPGTVHSFSMSGKVRVRTLYVRPGALPMPQAPTALRVTPLIRELLLKVLDGGDAGQGSVIADLVTPLLLTEIAGAVKEELGLPLPRSGALLAFAERVLAEPADRTPLDAICGSLGLTLKTLSRRFQRETGMTPDGWRRQARLIEGLARLRNGAAVTEAALDLGFASSASFAAAFRRCFGMTPSEARQREVTAGPA